MKRHKSLPAGGEDVGELLGAIGRRLHDHVRLEERVIFEQMQERFSDDELAEIGRRSESFRLALRGPQSIGTRRSPTCRLPDERELDT